MAVYDEPFERLLPIEKIVADPEQIIFGLLVDWNAGTNASMDKEEVATAVRQFKRLQKIEMLRRKDVRQLRGEPSLFVSIGIDARFKSIRQQGLETAVSPPLVQTGWIGEKARQKCFVVSAKEDRFASPPPSQQYVEHISRVGSPVDVIADKDGDRTADWAVPAIGIDRGEQSLQ